MVFRIVTRRTHIFSGYYLVVNGQKFGLITAMSFEYMKLVTVLIREHFETCPVGIQNSEIDYLYVWKYNHEIVLVCFMSTTAVHIQYLTA